MAFQFLRQMYPLIRVAAPLAQITRKGRVEINFDDKAERLCGSEGHGSAGAAPASGAHAQDLAPGARQALAVRSRRPAVPRCLHAIGATCVHQARVGGFFDFEAIQTDTPRRSSRGASTRASTSRFSRRPVWWSTSTRSCTGLLLAVAMDIKKRLGGQVSALRPLEGEAF